MILAITVPLCLLVLCLYGLWVWKKCIYSIPFVLLFFIEFAWGIISIVWIDHGVYISEQLRTSYFTGASIRYILLILPFALIFPWRTSCFIKKNIQRNRGTVKFRFPGVSFNKIAWYFGVVLMVYMYLDLLISGIPLFSSTITKSNYYSTFSKLPLANIIHNYFMPFLMLLSGIKFGKSIEDKKSGTNYIFMAGVILIYQFLLENKFYGLYDYMIFFIIPICILNYKLFLDKRKLPIKALTIALCCVSIFLFICYSRYTTTKTNALQYLLDRLFSLQSHTFWGIDLMVQNGSRGFNLNNIINEVIGGVEGVSITNANYGIAKIMYDVTAATYANDMLSGGFLFAGNFATVSISYSGYILTFLFSGILGEVLARISSIFYRYLKSLDLIGLFFAFWIYRRFYEYYRVGTLSIILSWKMIIIYIFIFFLANFRKKQN